MTDTPRLSRTFQTAPAGVPRENSAKYLQSGLSTEGFQIPDWLVPDLEDGTAPDMKETGLENTITLLPEYETFPGEIWPRVEWAYDDPTLRERGTEQIAALVGEVGEHLDGFVVPKVGRLADVEAAVATVADAEREFGFPEGTFEVSVIVETAAAKSDLTPIARFGADSRLAGLVFGPVDYAAELGGREIGGQRPRWAGLLEALSNETSASGLVGIGGPFDRLFETRAGVRFYNADGYADQVEAEARVGLDGSWSLYPKQTVQANRIHMPTGAELSHAVRAIEEFDDAKSGGTGAVTIDGQMVDEATYKNFVNTVETVRAIHDTRGEQAEAVYDAALLDRALGLDTDYRG